MDKLSECYTKSSDKHAASSTSGRDSGTSSTSRYVGDED